MVDPDGGALRAASLVRNRERDDAQLVARVAAGDERALGSLYDTYGAVVYGLALAITRNQSSAESVVADAFATVWRDAGDFDPGHRSVFAWISSLVRALALAERGRGEVAATSEPLALADTASPVGVALARLSGPQRRAIELAYFGGMSRRDIATTLGESEAAVGGYLKSAMESLKSVLHPEVPEQASRLVAGL